MRTLALCIAFLAVHVPVEGALLPGEALERYLAARAKLSTMPRAARMQAEIKGRLPGINGTIKEGRYLGLREVSTAGAVDYTMESIDGDDIVKRYVIARYIKTEIDSSQKPAPELAVTPANYKFTYRGLVNRFGRNYEIFEVEPRRSHPGLFRGEIWLDPVTFLPLREYGLFVKSPSVFLSSVYFVRDYWIVDGVPMTRRILSDIEVRLYGTAELEIWFSHFELADSPSPAVLDTGITNAPVPALTIRGGPSAR